MKSVACNQLKMVVRAFFMLGLMLYHVPVVAATPGDINGDGHINIADAILALKIIAKINLPPGTTVIKEADVSGDGKLGIEEVIYVLRTISEPNLLRLSAPNGGESLIAGTWHNITWEGHPGIDKVDILLSLDSGETYPYTLVSGKTNNGIYTWGPVPFHDPRKLSADCRIKIRSSVSPARVFDESDGLFSLVEPETAMLLSTLYEMNETLKMLPYEKDSDGDGLYDNVELYLGTDTNHPDSDRDGIPDYYEVFGDIFNIPVPDKDGDGLIAALDNDDDGDGVNDGRKMDNDGDGIPDYLELYGFIYVPMTEHLYYPWNGDITVPYYKTNPYQKSTDQDQYSDSMEITGVNMDLTVRPPGNSPMIPAFPNFIVQMTGYTVTLNSTITETDGTSHEMGSSWEHGVQQSTSTTDEWHWDVSTKVSAGLTDFGVEMGLSYGESYSATQSRGTSQSQGGQMSNGSQWSLATSTNPVEAAQIAFTFQVRNVGTATAKDVRITQNLMIGNMNVDTLTYPEGHKAAIPLMAPNESVTWNYPLMLTLEQLRALRTGAPVTVEVSTVAATVVRREGDKYVDVNDWGLYLNAAKSVSAHLFLDLGDGSTTEQFVYAGTPQTEGFQKVTLRDALIWAANGQNSQEGPMIRFYRPGGTLGPASLLEGWYFSVDPDTYDNISGYIQDPDYNFFDTVIKPGSLVVAKAPPAEPTPRIHWGEIAPRLKKVKAYVDDYFFRNPDFLEVTFVDKYGEAHPMDWDPDAGYFACPIPLNDDGKAYSRDGTEKILARNAMFYNTDDPRSPQYETEMSASQMSYLPSFEHPYSPVSSFQALSESVRDVFVRGEYAYIANSYDGLLILDVNPESPDYLKPVGTCPVPYITPVSRVFVLGDYAYMTDEYGELHIVDVNPESPGYLTIVGSYMLPGTAGGIFVFENLAYMTFGPGGMAPGPGLEGLVIVDVGDPEQPVLKGTFETPGSARNLFISGGYAYIAGEESGLQIIDITNPEAPALKGSYDTVAYGVFVSGSLAYIAGGDYRMTIIDVADPQNPVLKGSYAAYEFSNNVFVSGGFAYLAGEDGLRVLDVSNPENPAFVGSCEVNLSAHRLFVSGDYAYLTGGDFGGRRLHVININPSSPDYLLTPGSVKAGPAVDLTVADNYAYMAAQLRGLQIVDVDPASPGYLTVAGSYHTPGEANEVFISEGFAYVAAGYRGLQIVNVSNPKASALEGSAEIPGTAKSVFVSEGYAYVAYEQGTGGGLKIIDINPSSPFYLTITGSFDNIPYASGVFVSGSYAYVISRLHSSLRIFNISAPQTPDIAGSIEIPGEARSVFVSGNFAYVAAGSSGLQVVNILYPQNPVIAGAIDTPGYALDVYFLDGHALVADSQNGLQVVNVSDPRNPAIIGSCDPSEYSWGAFGVFASGEYAYMADEFGLQVITFK